MLFLSTGEWHSTTFSLSIHLLIITYTDLLSWLLQIVLQSIYCTLTYVPLVYAQERRARVVWKFCC
jgi:hypothetical protein